MINKNNFKKIIFTANIFNKTFHLGIIIIKLRFLFEKKIKIFYKK